MKSTANFVKVLSAILMPMMFASCVHEFPEEPRVEVQIGLNVTHTLEWTYREMTVTRSDGRDPEALSRYHFKIFKKDETADPVAEKLFTLEDLDRNDFFTTLSLPSGSYDLYAWSDYAEPKSGASLFFNSSGFSAITYSEPYNGNNHLRDAFRGFLSFTVNDRSDGLIQEEMLELERPLARYEFRATDIMEFIDKEITRGMLNRAEEPLGPNLSPEDIEQRLPELGNYRVRMIYSGYMPSKFDNILNRPVDSLTGIEYDAKITALSAEEARLGFDYVMVNGSESSIPVAMEIYDPNGMLVARSNPIDVPTKRGQATIVRGRFLTSTATGGVGINPDFNGDYNIEIR